MKNQLLHIFRNTPFGREIFLQSASFCSKTKTLLNIHIPKHSQFLMYFDNEVVTVDLDRAFLRSPETARTHAEKIIEEMGLEAHFLEPKRFTTPNLPELPLHFRYMCCPRSISDLSTRISLGHIGPRVRNIVRNSPFAILIPSLVFKEWKSIAVLFGGSENAFKALRAAMELSRLAGVPLTIFTQEENQPREYYRNIMKEHNLLKEIESSTREWVFFEEGAFRENMYAIPHDSLVVVGAHGHGLVKDLTFGSMMEQVQAVLPNTMLIIGPHFIGT